MLQIKSRRAGKVMYGVSDVKSFAIKTLPDFDPEEAEAYNAAPAESPAPVLELLTKMLRKRRDIYTAQKNDADVKRTDKVFRIASELQNGGWFDGVEFALAHMDLFPRNMLINADGKGNVNDPAITATVDWDDALFVPAFVGCSPPSFLWSQPGVSDLGADEIKQSFDEAAGVLYTQYAYKLAYKMARRVFLLALKGIDQKNYDWLVERWEDIKKVPRYGH
ncbi:hypothetical protein QBC43DRAFT_305041 [Cladorrhinum sp. PSN259]|nr:hypothetical protein QBC43DRAFT_305041 [Cladorrhinum sp. PSN259]